MRETRNRSAVTLLTTALVAGCGSVHGIPIDETAREIAEAVCPKAWSCCTIDQLMDNASSGADVATATQTCTTDVAPCERACETQTAEDFRHQLADIQRSVDQKRAVYEQAKVDACLDKIRSSTCEMLNVTNHLTGVPGCDSFVTPMVTMGGACSHDYECTSGWCRGDGTCGAPMSGMSCATDGCGEGFVCDQLNTSDKADDVCVQPQDNGAVCTRAIECKSGVCSSSGGSGMTCVAKTGPMCFYGSGCSAAGGPPGAASLLLLAGFGLLVARRARRRSGR